MSDITKMNTGDLEAIHRQISKQIMRLVQMRTDIQLEIRQVIADQHEIRTELDRRAGMV